MCTTPLTFDGIEVSCRECDQCVATYKNTWVSRCVAEIQTFPHALAFTLTYADDANGKPPLGAKVFRYADVQKMWKTLRYYGREMFGDDFVLRYIVVGEKGTKFGRCHYHGVMFSNYDLRKIGSFEGARTKGFAFKRRLRWLGEALGLLQKRADVKDIWPHGFVEFQQADRDGISYVLKYILKAKMTAEKSKGHKREGKTEWLASSYLWCSKKPAIGETWLARKAHWLLDRGMCFSSLRVRVPGGGDWYVNGETQKRLCLWLHQANTEFKDRTGNNLAGWSTLLASVSDEIENTETGELTPRKAKEWLENGEELWEPPADAAERAAAQFEQFKAEQLAIQSRKFGVEFARQLVRKCGGLRPCADCLALLTQPELDDLDTIDALAYVDWLALPYHKQGRNFEQFTFNQFEPSHYCQRRGENFHKVNFDYARKLYQAGKISVQTSSR